MRMYFEQACWNTHPGLRGCQPRERSFDRANGQCQKLAGPSGWQASIRDRHRRHYEQGWVCVFFDEPVALLIHRRNACHERTLHLPGSVCHA